MKLKRLWWTVRLFTIRGGTGRANYARKKGIYAQMGENVLMQSRVIPLYSELIKFHNNIVVARNVDFVAHDGIHIVLNRLPEEMKKEAFHYKERIGCIEVMDNVFIGSNSVILYDTKIGPNVVIASGSIVTKDCEPNSVYAGVPARKIGNFDDFVKKCAQQEIDETMATTEHNQALTESEIRNAWNLFNRKHNLH